MITINMKKQCITLILTLLTITSCDNRKSFSQLEQKLIEYTARKKADIGISVIIDSSDTISINPARNYPMMSVYKFPIALAVADYCRKKQFSFDDSCMLSSHNLHTDTYSPMLNKFNPADTSFTTIRELLTYSLQHSDNNASDILLARIGGADTADSLINSTGITDINIRWTENEMHADTSRCRQNSSTPLAMAALINNFFNAAADSLSMEIKNIMLNCSTGADRLSAPLACENIAIGHKTGTGYLKPDGGISAMNDVGHIIMPDGHHYSIAVFICNSHYTPQQTAAIIAEISEITYNQIKQCLLQD